ncbi:hypothetical protein FISHEDRAFT_46990 [Fistulina hepatica ATCC 64428]|uniref:DUF7719 domain-containing protein n=1 Tax=Fistulina hepatica ATCC 64428 TaxID=1128425 RepID=A0A0D7A8F3_9AGAR|nr:hypothetical protein FISHEDRAFT_46990 [Fistulina hepatica ATCC 64428]
MSTSRERGTRLSEQSCNTQRKPLIEISDEEKWRLIKESGLLGKVPPPDAPEPPSREPKTEEGIPLAEEIFNTTTLLIPFSFLLAMTDILIHHQYGRHVDSYELMERLATGVPILGLFIFYTIRYKHIRRAQFLMFLLSVFVGSRLLWLLARGRWLVVIRQCPPLATVWIYTIVQLDLGLAVFNLVVCAIYVWYKGLKLFK